MNKDKVQIKGIQAYGYHGVLGEEKILGQRFVVDVSFEFVQLVSEFCDNIDYTVSYADVTREVVGIVEKTSFNLIETLADKIARHIISYTQVAVSTVTVYKPAAPLDICFSNISATVTRSR